MPLCHVCLWCLCRHTAEYEATVCQFGVSNSDHPWCYTAIYCIYGHKSFFFLGFHATLSVEAIFGQLLNLISLFSLVSFTVKTECNRISHTAANGHEGWEERYTVNRQGWREGVLHRDPSTSNKKQMCELCVCSRLAPYSCCPRMLPKRNCCWQAADRRGFHAISRV